MKMGLKEKLGVILITAMLVLAPARVNAATVSEISKQLICQCGCTLVLANCTHSECMSRDTMLTLLEQKLAEGQSEEQIIQFFVVQYGEQVLASPPKRGFNLMAWITPFVAILAGGGIIYIVIKKWVRRGTQPQTYPIAEEEDEKYRHQLEEELKEFAERSFR
jgi:cytochrome c-type biogenesis protein CcmH